MVSFHVPADKRTERESARFSHCKSKVLVGLKVWFAAVRTVLFCCKNSEKSLKNVTNCCVIVSFLIKSSNFAENCVRGKTDNETLLSRIVLPCDGGCVHGLLVMFQG